MDCPWVQCMSLPTLYKQWQHQCGYKLIIFLISNVFMWLLTYCRASINNTDLSNLYGLINKCLAVCVECQKMSVCCAVLDTTSLFAACSWCRVQNKPKGSDNHKKIIDEMSFLPLPFFHVGVSWSWGSGSSVCRASTRAPSPKSCSITAIPPSTTAIGTRSVAPFQL